MKTKWFLRTPWRVSEWKTKGFKMMCRWNETGLLLAPFFSFLARLSSRPPPATTSDEGAGRRKELSHRSRESLAAHLGARRGGAVRRSVRWRRINGVSPPSPSPWVDPHGPPFLFVVFIRNSSSPLFVSLKNVWFWHETIQNIELLILLKIDNWPIKYSPEQGGLPF